MLYTKKKLFIQLFLATTFLTAGCLLIYFHSKSRDFLLEYGRTLKPDGLPFKMWRKFPTRMYQKFYIFNWTNPQDINEKKSKPHFEEVGPFVFEDRQEKVDLVWNDNETITYRLLREWFFEEDKSVGNLSTKITTINAVSLSAAYCLRFWSYLLKKGLDYSMRLFSQKIFIRQSVGNILFDGYEDPILNLAGAMRISSFLTLPNTDKFGWFYQRNGTNSGDVFNTKTKGNELGQILQWNFKSELPYFRGECNKIKGSLNEFQPIPLKRDKLAYFWTEICRNFVMDYVGEHEVEGIVGYKYVIGDSFLENGTAEPENLCFDNNLPYGMVNVSSCKYGTPSFISLPHFYKADSYFTDKVEGLGPNKTKHEMFFTLEPATGILLRGAARFQLNVQLQPIAHISMFAQVPTVYVPIFWIEQTFELSFMYCMALKVFLNLPSIMLGTAVVCIALGIACMYFGIRMIKLKRRKLLKRDVKYPRKNTSATIREKDELLANSIELNKL